LNLEQLETARHAVRQVEQRAAKNEHFTVQVAQSLRSTEQEIESGAGLRAGVTSESFHDDRTRVPCIEGYIASYVDADGTVFGCCLRSSSIGNHFMGDATKTPFAEIWRGEAYRAFRREAFSVDLQRADMDENSCAHCPKAKHFLYLIDEFTPGNYLDLARRKADELSQSLSVVQKRIEPFAKLPPEAMRPAFVSHDLPAESSTGTTLAVSMTIRNDSERTWPGGDLAGQCAVGLGYHLLDRRGRMICFDNNPRAYLPHDLAPREEIVLGLSVTAPNKPGVYQIELAMVQENVAWFERHGGATLRVPWKVVS